MTLKLRDGVSTANTDYGVMLLDEYSGQYWNLNPTAAVFPGHSTNLPRAAR